VGRWGKPENGGVEDIERLRRQISDDERLLRQAEKALTEIKVAQGLADEQASVLAALRIRLRGDPGKSLEDLLTAAGDLAPGRLESMLEASPKEKRSLDDVLSQKPKPKPDWPSD
jgi:hypothetical protein